MEQRFCQFIRKSELNKKNFFVCPFMIHSIKWDPVNSFAPYLILLALTDYLVEAAAPFAGALVFAEGISSGKNKMVGNVKCSINISGDEPNIVILLPPISLVGTTTKLSA